MSVLTDVMTPCNDSHMNATTAPAAQSLADVSWIEAGKVASFQSARLFGVTDGAGRWATWNGVTPMAYARKSTAVEIATTAIELQWMDVA